MNWSIEVERRTWNGRLPESFERLANALEGHEEIPREVLVEERGVPRRVVDEAVERSVLAARGHSGRVWVQPQVNMNIWTLDRRVA